MDYMNNDRMSQRPRRDTSMNSNSRYASTERRNTSTDANCGRADYGQRYTGTSRQTNYSSTTGGGRAYRATPDGNGTANPTAKRPRQRIGMSRVNNTPATGYTPRPTQAGQERRPQYGTGRPQGNRPRMANPGAKPYGNRRPQGRPMQRPTTFKRPRVFKYPEVVTDPNEEIRLNKFLSNAGICSRREADEFIKKGEIMVNGEVVTTLGKRITRQDIITFGGRTVQIQSKIYIVMNKPRRCFCSTDAPEGQPQVLNLLGNACQERVYPVGRLNRNTTGVLLLTNDGTLASKLTHPDYKKKSVYQVRLDKPISPEDMQKIVEGVQLTEGEIHAEEVRYINEQDYSQIGIQLNTGVNNSVHRLFVTLGYRVLRLNRVYYAGLTCKGLPAGKWRYLGEQEVKKLREGLFE